MVEKGSPKEKLILAALAEVEQSGTIDFSIRRVAERCGVSCAAPYKHFESKDELLCEVFSYICSKWSEQKAEILARPNTDLKNHICDLCMAYICFLTDNPEYMRIILSYRPRFSWEKNKEGTEPTIFDRSMFDEYCDMRGLDSIAKLRLLHSMIALVYGSAIMFLNGEAPYTVGYIGMTRFDIERMLSA